jgi:competence ComEA-like helix-hairpin-helix protein
MTNKYSWTLITLVLFTGVFFSSIVFASGKDATTSTISNMPVKAQEIDPSKALGKAQGKMDKININEASIESLSKIPGLDSKVGEAIAAYRDANGAFKSLSELANIDGIDASLLEKIKPFLSL